MAQQVINIGASPNDGTGDFVRDAFDKTNDNFTELYSSSGGGGNLLATHILTKPKSTFYYSTALSPNLLNTNYQDANALTTTMFTPAYDLTINTLILQVVVAAAASAKIAIYSDLDGVPHTKLHESVSVDTSTTGIKTITGFTFTFNAGVTYWISSVVSAAGVSFRTLNAYSYFNAPAIAASSSTQVYTSFYIPVTYASLPSVLTTPTTSNLAHQNYTYISFRAV